MIASDDIKIKPKIRFCKKKRIFGFVLMFFFIFGKKRKIPLTSLPDIFCFSVKKIRQKGNFVITSEKNGRNQVYRGNN